MSSDPQLTQSVNQPETLTKKTMKGAFWLFMFQVSDNAFGFVRLLILARLLSPKDFGLVGIAWLIIQIISTFTQSGYSQALIQKTDTHKYLNAAWTFGILRGLILYSIIIFLSPLIAILFNAHESISLLKILSLPFIFEGLGNIGVVLFYKELKLHKQFLLQFSGTFINFIVSVVLGLIYHNVWAIVLGGVAGSFTIMIMGYVLSSYRPKWHFDVALFKELNNFGKWIFSSTILTFLFTQGDDILVGKILGPISLGYYQLAYKISNLPATQITSVASGVLFPAYSKIKNDIKAVSDAYLLAFQLLTFSSFFIGIVIILFAHDFIILFLGTKWLPMTLSLQILTLWGVIRSIGSTAGPLWQALGTPKTITKIQTIQVIVLGLTIYPLLKMYSIEGTSIAVVLSALIPNIIAVYLIIKTIKRDYKVVLKEIVLPFISVITVSAILVVERHIFFNKTSFVVFLLEAISVTIIYFSLSVIYSKYLHYSIYDNFLMLSNNVPYLQKHKDSLKKLHKLLS